MNFSGDPCGSMPWCLAFKENLYGPIKVVKSIPRDQHCSMDGSSQTDPKHIRTQNVAQIIPQFGVEGCSDAISVFERLRCKTESSIGDLLEPRHTATYTCTQALFSSKDKHLI